MTKHALVLEQDDCTSGASQADRLFAQLRADGLDPEAVATWRRVCDYDLSRERALLTSPDRMFRYSEEHAAKMEDEYRKFLFLRIMHPDQPLPMSQEVDDYWHAHVMSTRNYQRFIDECANGQFIHHRPTVSDEENMALMFAYINGTIERYRQHFGEPPAEFWRQDPTTACCYC